MQSCILCLEEGANLKQLNHCGIYYIHKQCHSKWISKNNTCIVCREQIVKERTIVVQRQEIQEIQESQESQEIHERQHYSNYRIIHTLQFKMVYTIIVIIMTLITAYIFFIW
jgi:hypothetical protein